MIQLNDRYSIREKCDGKPVVIFPKPICLTFQIAEAIHVRYNISHYNCLPYWLALKWLYSTLFTRSWRIYVHRYTHTNTHTHTYIYIYIYLQCGAAITRTFFFKIFTIDTQSSPVRVGYGVSFVVSGSDWYSTSLPAMMCAIPCFTRPRYNITRLYIRDVAKLLIRWYRTMVQLLPHQCEFSSKTCLSWFVSWI